MFFYQLKGDNSVCQKKCKLASSRRVIFFFQALEIMLLLFLMILSESISSDMYKAKFSMRVFVEDIFNFNIDVNNNWPDPGMITLSTKHTIAAGKGMTGIASFICRFFFCFGAKFAIESEGITVASGISNPANGRLDPVETCDSLSGTGVLKLERLDLLSTSVFISLLLGVRSSEDSLLFLCADIGLNVSVPSSVVFSCDAIGEFKKVVSWQKVLLASSWSEFVSSTSEFTIKFWIDSRACFITNSKERRKSDVYVGRSPCQVIAPRPNTVEYINIFHAIW